MIFVQKKKKQLYKIINKLESEKLKTIFGRCIQPLINFTNDNWIIFLIKIALLLLFMGCFLGPYILIGISIYLKEQNIIIIILLICSISFTILLVGNLGNSMCLCLYQPCNWFFFMLCCNLITIGGEIFVFVYYYKKVPSYAFYISMFLILENLVLCLVFFIQEIIVFRLINLIYTFFRTIELSVMYYCVNKYLKNECAKYSIELYDGD